MEDIHAGQQELKNFKRRAKKKSRKSKTSFWSEDFWKPAIHIHVWRNKQNQTKKAPDSQFTAFSFLQCFCCFYWSCQGRKISPWFLILMLGSSARLGDVPKSHSFLITHNAAFAISGRGYQMIKLHRAVGTQQNLIERIGHQNCKIYVPPSSKPYDGLSVCPSESLWSKLPWQWSRGNFCMHMWVVYTCETFSTLPCFMFFRSFSHAS